MNIISTTMNILKNSSANKRAPFRFNSGSDLRTISESLMLSLSDSLNLLIFKGKLTEQSMDSSFKDLMKRLIPYFCKHDNLSVYINLNQIDSVGLANLFNLAQVLNTYHQQGKDIAVYWNSQNKTLNSIADSFRDIFSCSFFYSDK